MFSSSREGLHVRVSCIQDDDQPSCRVVQEALGRFLQASGEGVLQSDLNGCLAALCDCDVPRGTTRRLGPRPLMRFELAIPHRFEDGNHLFRCEGHVRLRLGGEEGIAGGSEPACKPLRVTGKVGSQ